jgi:eukaryotic-like serine/threonine-protein kinase
LVVTAESDWHSLKSVVVDALDLAPENRQGYLDSLGLEPYMHREATQLLAACEQALANAVLDSSAAKFAAPIIADIDEKGRALPESLRAALVGSYTIERELGRGGMATVYLARDERHRRHVALKLLRAELLDDAPKRAAARFEREIGIAARLSHPHILPLFDSGTVGSLLYYITPYVNGESLRDRLKRLGRLPVSESVRVIRDVARALAYAHRQDVVHRDIKPANILLNEEGDALVGDFGVAKALAAAQGSAASDTELTDAAFILGTPAYMAPEQVSGSSEIDHRADLYALGATAYELLSGSPPFGGRSRHEQLVAHLTEEPERIGPGRPDIPDGLASLVHRLLAKQPRDRPRDANEVLEVLDEIAAGLKDDTIGSAAIHEHAANVRITRRFSPRAGLVLAGGLFILVVGAALRQKKATRIVAPVSIAVLPFDWIADSATSYHLAVGISDAIGRDLAQLTGALSPSYVTTSIYRQSSKSVKQIASEQQVRGVLRGNIQSVNNGIRVTAQLFDGASGKRVWERRYVRGSTELPEIERDIVQRAAAAFEVRLTKVDRDFLAQPLTRVRGAYDAYLRGRAAELAGQSPTSFAPVPFENVRSARSLYARARDMDPTFADARARLALMQTLAASMSDTTAARREQARLEAEAALRLQPNLPEAHQALASYWALSGNIPKAIDELTIALRLFPHSAGLRFSLGNMFELAGRLEDALAAYDSAMHIEPGQPVAAFATAAMNSRLRRPAQAIRAFNRALAAAPDFHIIKVVKGHVYLRWTGIPDTLAALMRTVPLNWDPNGEATYARFTAMWVQRRYSDALAMLDESKSELSHDEWLYHPSSLMRAQLHELLGEEKLARVNYETARSFLRDSVAAHPDDPHMRVTLALALAGLGQRAEAGREARRAMELVPAQSHVQDASSVMGVAVEVFAKAGEIDNALELLELLLSMHAGREATVPYLRVWPGVDPLRSDPRFEQMLVRFTADSDGDISPRRRQ